MGAAETTGGKIALVTAIYCYISKFTPIN